MAKPLPLLPLLVTSALALSSVGCCKKGSDSSQGAAPAETTAAGATTTAPAPAPSPASTAPAPLDPAKKAQLVALFEKNKAGIDKCTPIHKDMMKAQASKDVPTMVMKSQQFVACRNGWVSGLMPKITPLGITEDQAREEMMTWDNARKK